MGLEARIWAWRMAIGPLGWGMSPKRGGTDGRTEGHSGLKSNKSCHAQIHTNGQTIIRNRIRLFQMTNLHIADDWLNDIVGQISVSKRN